MSNIKNLLKKNLHKVLSYIKIFKLLQGLVGFGYLRFAEIKSCPSAYQTSQLSKAELILDHFLTLLFSKIFIGPRSPGPIYVSGPL